jgi:hypothetical protein
MNVGENRDPHARLVPAIVPEVCRRDASNDQGIASLVEIAGALHGATLMARPLDPTAHQPPQRPSFWALLDEDELLERRSKGARVATW